MASSTASSLVVIDVSGVHSVRVFWCECLSSPGGASHCVQLLRICWFPTARERPNTVVTFSTLEFFHLLTLQAKTTFYDFYEMLARKTDDSGLGHHQVSIGPHLWFPELTYEQNKYRESMRSFRQWRHLKTLKRHGRGHIEQGIDNVGPGTCAVECPACPHPGRNLPDNWQDCPVALRCVYSSLSLERNDTN